MIKKKINKLLRIHYILRKLKSNFHNFDLNNIPKNEKFEFANLLVLLITKINNIKLKLFFKNRQNLIFFRDYCVCLDNVYKNNNLNFNRLYSELKISTKQLSKKLLELLQTQNQKNYKNVIENFVINGILYFYIDKNIGKFDIDPTRNIKNEKQYQQMVNFNIMKIKYLKEIKKSLMSLMPRDFNDMMVYIMELSQTHI